MKHFKVESQSAGALASAYPHDPQDIIASIQDYLEDKLSDGLEYVSGSFSSTADHIVFRVVGCPDE